MNQKNILIISYIFPPYPGVGGRRWAKFAKYLHREGHHVFVISAKNPFKEISTFTNDISELPKENIYYLPPKYPSIVLKQPKTIWEKSQYYFWIKVLPLFTDGNYYDRAMFWKRQLHSTIKKIIKQKKIDVIIVTGAPFHLVYLTVLLKKDFPNIKFVVDYRDEWTFNNVYGLGLIGEKRRQKEFTKEKFVCKIADIVSSCHESILNYINNKYDVKKLLLLPHSYDVDDFSMINFNSIDRDKSNKINICYFGTIQPGTQFFFEQLINCLNFLKNQNNELYQKLQFNFYLISHFSFENIIANHREKFIFHNHLISSDLFNKIILSDFVLIISSHRAKDYFTSKYPEIFYLKKPIILYSEDGIVSEFIKKNKIGVHLSKKNFCEEFIYAIQNPLQFNYDNMNTNNWDYKSITKKLIKHIS